QSRLNVISRKPPARHFAGGKGGLWNHSGPDVITGQHIPASAVIAHRQGNLRFVHVPVVQPHVGDRAVNRVNACRDHQGPGHWLTWISFDGNNQGTCAYSASIWRSRGRFRQETPDRGADGPYDPECLVFK